MSLDLALQPQASSSPLRANYGMDLILTLTLNATSISAPPRCGGGTSIDHRALEALFHCLPPPYHHIEAPWRA